MKRILLIALVVLAATSCKKITPETRIAEINRFFQGKEDVHTPKLQQYQGKKQLDYLNLILDGELDAATIWVVEADGQSSMLAEFPGSDKKGDLTMISASLDDPQACSAVLEAMEALKQLKIQHKNTIRTLFYAPAPDSTGQNGLAAVNDELRSFEELILFDIELTTGSETVPTKTFVIEEKPDFARQLIEIIQPYMAPLGDYQFEQGIYPNPSWPLKTSIYRYNVDPGDFQKDVAAVTSFAYLLN